MPDIYHNGSIITKEHKEKRKLLFIEELFVGSFFDKAPQTLRKKMTTEIMEKVEMGIKFFYRAPIDSRVVFKNYTHFKKTLNDVGINLKRYLK
jgi:hypothetical protein